MKSPIERDITRLPIADILVQGRLRPVSEAGVESLIASITELGVMKDAVHVRRGKDGKLVLIAGGHRLEAARRLGWETIPAKVWSEVTDDWALMMEVDDNLAGAEMDALDTAVFLATRKRLYEKLHPEAKAKAGKALAEQRWNAADMMSVASFATTTAQKFGLTDRHVRRMAAAGDRLAPDEVKRLRAAPRAVTLADLQEIGQIGDAPERYAVVAALAEGKATSAARARRAWAEDKSGVKAPVKDPVELAFQALCAAWDRAPIVAKKRFLLDRAREVWEAQNKGASLIDAAKVAAAETDVVTPEGGFASRRGGAGS